MTNSSNDLDYLYYNIEIYNDPVENNNESILAKFSETRVTPILEHANLYDLSVVRFSVPSNQIPIFIWPGDDVYKISLEWRGVIVSSYLKFISTNLGTPDSIFTYQTICDIINVSLLDVWEQMKILFPGTLPGDPDFKLFTKSPPKWIYDPSLKVFLLRTPYDTEPYNDNVNPVSTLGHWKSNEDQNDPLNNIKLYFNKACVRFVTGFQITAGPNINDLRYQMVIKNNYNNIAFDTPGSDLNLIYNVPQSYSTTSYINDMDDLIFRTNRIPLTYELLGTQTNNFQSIMTDFNILKSEFTSDDIQYFPSGPLRYYPLYGHDVLKTIDLQIYWRSGSGQEYPVIISPGDRATVKIQFRKRSSEQILDAIESKNLLI